MAIRPKAVLQALQDHHGGVLRAAGTDAAVKLLRSMRKRDGLVSELREHLHVMAEMGQIVIECQGIRFDLIAIPDALAALNVTDTKEGEHPMIAPAGRRKTTYARDGQGRELPSHLRDKDVGELTVTYKNPEAGEAIATAAELVREELVKDCSKLRHGREELLATIQALLLPLYDGKAEVAQALAAPVLGFLFDNGHAKRVPVPGRHREFVIEIVLAEVVEVDEPEPVAQTEFDPIEMLARLAPELETARGRLAELETLLENAVDPNTVAKITERAEEIQAENEGLRRKLDAAGAEKTQILEAQKARLAKIRTDFQATLDKLHREHETAMAALRKEMETALAAKAALEATAQQRRGLPPDLQRRVEKLLGT